jgi:hypothetical protein
LVSRPCTPSWFCEQCRPQSGQLSPHTPDAYIISTADTSVNQNNQ